MMECPESVSVFPLVLDGSVPMPRRFWSAANRKYSVDDSRSVNFCWGFFSPVCFLCDVNEWLLLGRTFSQLGINMGWNSVHFRLKLAPLPCTRSGRRSAHVQHFKSKAFGTLICLCTATDCEAIRVSQMTTTMCQRPLQPHGRHLQRSVPTRKMVYHKSSALYRRSSQRIRRRRWRCSLTQRLCRKPRMLPTTANSS